MKQNWPLTNRARVGSRLVLKSPASTITSWLIYFSGRPLIPRCETEGTDPSLPNVIYFNVPVQKERKKTC